MMELYSDLIDRQCVAGYLRSLVGRFYKILPMCEDHSLTLDKYMNSLLREMLGCELLADSLRGDDRYVSLLSILRSLIADHENLGVVKADVFRAINIITQLEMKYQGV